MEEERKKKKEQAAQEQGFFDQNAPADRSNITCKPGPIERATVRRSVRA